MRIAIVALVVVLVLAGFLLLPNAPGPEAPSYQLLAEPASSEFDKVLEPRKLEFPKDHGPHLDYQTEWWYYTGNLESETGDLYGYQLTIFRRGLTPGDVDRASNFGTNQVYFGHLAISDVDRGKHTAHERFARGAAELAGSSGEPFEVHLGDWRIETLDEFGDSVRLQAREGDIALELVLTAAKPIVAHGEGGFSPKGEEQGNATYYLSFTDMDTRGRLYVDGREIEVEGSSWFDHEWGTSALGPNATGWDWFGLQLDDGRELMLFEIRTSDGGTEEVSGGTIVYPDGTSAWLTRDQIEISPTGNWTSPETGVTYPSGWRIFIPELDIELNIEPLIRDQEMRLTIEYWEGAVRVSGSANGRGYVELTGYSGSMEGLF